MVAILSKFTVLCLSSYFVVYFLELELILFYNRVFFFFYRAQTQTKTTKMQTNNTDSDI